MGLHRCVKDEQSARRALSPRTHEPSIVATAFVFHLLPKLGEHRFALEQQRLSPFRALDGIGVVLERVLQPDGDRVLVLVLQRDERLHLGFHSVGPRQRPLLAHPRLRQLLAASPLARTLLRQRLLEQLVVLLQLQVAVLELLDAFSELPHCAVRGAHLLFQTRSHSRLYLLLQLLVVRLQLRIVLLELPHAISQLPHRTVCRAPLLLHALARSRLDLVHHLSSH
mmetsp:Transcript_13081/g.31053  ORF Transcript_13081/g.31053 Transcript_13081/m.31053 type:complete len:225 (+) Transcript_13081:1402-2076(+)